jgi:hypothetical protein
VIVRRVFFGCLVLVACLPDPGADLEGPRVLSSSMGRHAVEVPVVPTLELELSEPLDVGTLSSRHLTLIRWEEVGRCDLTPVCAKGRCGAGRCWEDPLSASDLSALDGGEYGADADGIVELHVEAEGARVVLHPVSTLEPHARYSLVLGEGVRDPSGAGLVDEAGGAARWRSDFVTGAEDSAGPMPRLVFPTPGAVGVPTNLVRIETRFLGPVEAAEGASLRVADLETGAPIEVAMPVPCEGWVPGFCAAWKIEGELPADADLAVIGGTLVDADGRGVVAPWGDESFRTGDGPDLEPPDIEGAVVGVRGPCVLAELHVEESLRLGLGVGDATIERAVDGGGPVRIGVRPIDAAPEVARLEASDLAGNVSSVEHPITLGSPPPSLALTEVLANPAGPEPHQEFVELVNFGSEAIDLGGLWLADLSWEEVQTTLADGASLPGDPLPAVSLAPGEIALVVAAGYEANEGSDASPPPTARLLRVDASLGQAGLKNAGEPLTLYRSDPPELVASYGNFVDTSASDHAGRSVGIVRPTACDVADSWSSHPLGAATPGRLP